jgi:hypothetical protein
MQYLRVRKTKHTRILCALSVFFFISTIILLIILLAGNFNMFNVGGFFIAGISTSAMFSLCCGTFYCMTRCFNNRLDNYVQTAWYLKNILNKIFIAAYYQLYPFYLYIDNFLIHLFRYLKKINSQLNFNKINI